MRAYITVRPAPSGSKHFGSGLWVGKVYTKERGGETVLHVCRHTTQPASDPGTARDRAKEWAEEVGYRIVHAEDV